MDFLLLFFAGVLGGLLAGILGIGGGIIYVFVLDYFLIEYGVLPSEYAQFIVSNSLFCVFFASLSSTFALIKQKEFYTKHVLLLGIPAVIISLITLHFVVNTTWFTKDKFSIVIMTLLMYMLYRTIKKTISSNQDTVLNKINPILLSLAGCAGGFVASISGLGGGVVMVPLLNGVFRVNIKIAKSISLGVIVITSFAITISNLFQYTLSEINTMHTGLIIFPVTLIIAVGVIIGGPIGVKVSSRMNNKTIAIIYSIFLSLFIMKKGVELFFV